MAPNKIRAMVVFTAVFVMIGGIGMPLVAGGTAVAQEANTTSTATGTPTPTATPAAETCETPTNLQMDQARLYAPEKTITAGEAGRIDGGFKLDNTMDCPVKVVVTLRVPSGMSISGGSDWGSAGAGMVSTSFIMQPGSGIMDLSGNVYSERTGQLRVTGDIEYWPAGHPEQSQEIDGLTFNFDVQEPNSPPAGSNSEQGTASDQDNDDSVIVNIPDIGNDTLILLLVALGMIGMMYVAPKVGVNLRK